MFKKPTFIARGNVNLMQDPDGLIAIHADEISFFCSLDDLDLHTNPPQEGLPIVNEPNLTLRPYQWDGEELTELVDPEYIADRAKHHESI